MRKSCGSELHAINYRLCFAFTPRQKVAVGWVRGRVVEKTMYPTRLTAIHICFESNEYKALLQILYLYLAPKKKNYPTDDLA